MRQYVYSPHQIGLDSWPSGELRLEGIEVTKEPDLADVFIVPGALTALFPDKKSLYRLPYFHGNQEKHVFLDVSDNEPLYDEPCMFLRCNTRPWYLQRDPSTLPQAWPVDDVSECIPVPEGGFKYDVSGHMWLSSEVRKASMETMKNQRMLKADLAGYPNFTGYIYYEAEGIRRRKEFRRSMRESRIALCPESIVGVFPYRFFEAMSAGRVPLLVGSDFCFPWNTEIDYESFMIHCQRSLANTCDQMAIEFIRTHSDEEIIAMGLKARAVWERWLDSRKWPELHAEAVIKHLEMRKAA